MGLPESNGGRLRRRRPDRGESHRATANDLLRAAAERALSYREVARDGAAVSAADQAAAQGMDTEVDGPTVRRRRPTHPAAHVAAGNGEPSATVESLRVLVAEDDPPAREILRELLEALGHQVLAAVGSGPEAVEGLVRLGPDVVLLDVHMPGGSGLDAAEEIASRAPGTAIVLISGDRELRLSDQQVSATTAHACLPKPVTPASLDATLRLADARSRAEHAARGEARMRKRQLEQRKLVERAKGLMMRRLGCSEEQAYRTLRRTSQDRSVPLVDIARALLEGESGAAGR